MRAAILLLLVAAAPVRLHGGFRFVEGPAADAAGNVYFNDIPNERLYRAGVDGALTLVREKTNRANGLFFHGSGALYACEGGAGAVVAYDRKRGTTRRVIADKFNGKRFNSPNDLVLDRRGGVYFTDPFFGRKQGELPQGVHGVYYVAPGGSVTRLVAGLPKPNGIILSPDEKTLYVVCSGQAEVMAYRVGPAGRVDGGRVLFSLKQPAGKSGTGGDGLTVDTDGKLYITSRLGVQVVSPEGKLVRVLEFPEKPANCTFGGKDRRTLFVTARTSLYTLRLKAQGHLFPAGGP